MRDRAIRILLALMAALLIPACLEEQEAAADLLMAPSGLSAVALPEGARVQLTWMDNSAMETGFRVDVADTPIVADADVDEWTLVPANVSTYTYAAQPNTTRYFRVLAITTFNQSPPSNGASAMTPNVPMAPGRLDALAGPNGTDLAVTVMWDDTANETGYTIERSTDGSTWVPLATLGMNATSYLDGSSAAEVTYSYRVRGTNANGPGVWAVSPPARVRSGGWDKISSNAFGDVSWYASLAVRFGTAYLTAYDATYGDLVWSLASVGSTQLSPSAIHPPFPETLGYSGTSVVVRNLMYPDYVAVDAFNNTLCHLNNSTGSWVSTTLDSAADDDRAIVKAGPDDILHVVYQHDAGGYKALRHAWYSGNWNYEWLDSSLQSSDYLASAVDGSNGLHVAYRRPLGGGTYELRYVYKPAGGSPTSEVVPTSGTPEMCSIAAGAAGTIYLVYNSLSTGGLHLATRSSGTWSDELVHRSPRNSWGRYNSVAWESGSGELHVSYIDNIYGTVRYATRAPGGAWEYYLIERAGNAGRFTCVGTDDLGQVFIAYGDGNAQELKLAMNAIRPPSNLIVAPNSTSQILVTWTGVSNATSYRLERSIDGGLTWSTHATFGPMTGMYLDTGLFSSTEYFYRLVALSPFGESTASNSDYAVPVYLSTPAFGSSSSYGEATGIVAGAGGTLYVSHHDVTNSNTLFTTGSHLGGFTTITADSGPAATSIVGYQGTSIVRESTGDVRIVSSHISNGGTGVLDLRYTSIPAAGSPASTTLESTGQVGQEPRIGKSDDGVLQILHRESVVGGHRYRRGIRTGTTWTFGYVTSAELIGAQYGQYFAVAPNGNANFVYLYYAAAGGTPELRYAREAAPGFWNITTLNGAGDGLLYPSIAVDAAGFAHMTYIATPPGAGTYAIMYATNASGAWVFETIWPSTFFSTYGQPTIAVDRVSGRVHVAYGSNNLLRYARKDPGAAWTTQRLAKGSNLGWLSMVVDSSGMIHIAFRDEAITRLRIVSGSP